MFSTWTISGLKIQHLGAQGECLAEDFIFGRGGFSISNLARRIRISRQSKVLREPTAIDLSTNSTNFSVSIPSNFQIVGDENHPLWTGDLSRVDRVSFSWAEMPKALAIVLPNQSRLTLRKSSVPAFSKESPLIILAPILGAFAFHSVAAALIALTPSTPDRPPMKVAVDLISKQIASPSSAQRHVDSNDSGDTITRVRNTKNLLKNFTLGKSKRRMAYASNSTTRLDKIFSDRQNIASKTWSIDQDIAETNEVPLNLTEAQIKSALQPAYRRLKECYEDLLIQDSSLRGQPQLRIDVNQLGRISDVQLSLLEGQPRSVQKLRECFVRAYQTIQVPKPNREFQVVHTLVLNH